MDSLRGRILRHSRLLHLDRAIRTRTLPLNVPQLQCLNQTSKHNARDLLLRTVLWNIGTARLLRLCIARLQARQRLLE